MKKKNDFVRRLFGWNTAVAALVILLVPALVEAQALRFEQDSIYTGRLSIDEAPFTYAYTFTVAPEVAIRIDNIETDCGCALATIPERELEANDSSSISLTYDPYAPGPFEKSVKITYTPLVGENELKQEEVALKLKGYLEAFESNVRLDFPFSQGNLKLAQKQVTFGTVGNKSLVSREVEVYNPTDEPINFLDSVVAPEAIEVLFIPTFTVPAKGKGRFTVYLHADKLDEYGFQSLSFNLFTDNSQTSQIDMKATVTIAEERTFGSQSPQILLEADTVDLGKVQAERLPIVPITLSNAGKETLEILKLEPNPGIQVITSEKEAVPPMSSSNINLGLTDIGRRGEQERTLAIFTNDPAQPVKTLVVKMVVQ